MAFPSYMTPDVFRKASPKVPGRYTVQIGRYTLTEPREVTEYYECALWHKTITVQPGEYPILGYVGGHRTSSVCIQFTGEVTTAHFAPRIGAHIGKDTEGPALLGKTDTVGQTTYLYSLRDDENATLDEATFDTEAGYYVIPNRPSTEGLTLPVGHRSRHISCRGTVSGVHVTVWNRGSETEHATLTVIVGENDYGILYAEFPYRFEGVEGIAAANRLAARVEERGTIAAHLWCLRTG